MRDLVKKVSYTTIAVLMVVFAFKPITNRIDFVEYHTIKENVENIQPQYYVIEREYDLSTEEAVEGVPLEASESKIGEGIYQIPKLERYKVLEGETIASIAQKYNISPKVLRANNPEVDKEVKAGEVINIIKSNGVFYRVKRGDTILKITSNYGIDIDKFKEYNNLKTDILQIGQELFILNPTEAVLQDIMKENGELKGYKTFAMPVKWAGITSPFGSRFHPVLKRYIQHQGVDMKARYVPLSAAKDGVVTFAGYLSGYGKIIMINHGKGYETRSAHLSEIYVKKGMRVKEGDIIGKTGMSGRVTGPHLHFEIRRNGKANNPMNYLVQQN